MLYLIFFNYIVLFEVFDWVLFVYCVYLDVYYVSGYFLMLGLFFLCEGGGILVCVEFCEEIDDIVVCDFFVIENFVQVCVIVWGLNCWSVDILQVWLLDVLVVMLI